MRRKERWMEGEGSNSILCPKTILNLKLRWRKLFHSSLSLASSSILSLRKVFSPSSPHLVPPPSLLTLFQFNLTSHCFFLPSSPRETLRRKRESERTRIRVAVPKSQTFGLCMLGWLKLDEKQNRSEGEKKMDRTKEGREMVRESKEGLNGLGGWWAMGDSHSHPYHKDTFGGIL